jgi:hypothetical protein
VKGTISFPIYDIYGSRGLNNGVFGDSDDSDEGLIQLKQVKWSLTSVSAIHMSVSLLLWPKALCKLLHSHPTDCALVDD